MNLLYLDRWCLYSGLLIAGLVSQTHAQDSSETLHVGVQADGRIVVPTNQILQPAGKQIAFPGRPVDLALANEGKTLVVKNMKSLVFIDTASETIQQTLDSPTGFSVVGLAVQNERVYVSDALDHIRIARKTADGKYQWEASLALEKPKVGGAAHPAGLLLMEPGELWVASTRGNNMQRVNLQTGKVEQTISVGVAPYTIGQLGDYLYVSNWGGDLPKAGDPQATSSGSAVQVNPRTGIANRGSVSMLRKVEGQWKQTDSIQVGLHPSGLAILPGSKALFVANAGSDTVTLINGTLNAVFETIECRSDGRLPFGSGCNAVAVDSTGTRLYVANGTNNCVAVVELGRLASRVPGNRREEEASKLLGLIPTGWYPGAIQLSRDGKKLYVANIKGQGSLSLKRVPEKGRNSHDHLGTVSIIDIPDSDTLKNLTLRVHTNNRLAYSVAGLEKPRAEAPPIPIPQRHGEPSPIEHVVYVIKENRTYDQVFGDIKEGNGDPRLLLFGEDVTPNHHALARQFTLFDNFYCSGVLSADGHQWVNEAYVTDYLERAFGNFTRSYPYEGSDPLAFAPSGFLWDNALARKKTFRNYGEFTKTTYKPAKLSWLAQYRDLSHDPRKIQIEAKPNVKPLEPYTHPGYPGFVLTTPDVYRARIFLEDLKRYEERGSFPNLTYVYLPCDHTSGTRAGMPTPRASVADNDLALGQVVEGLSKSKFWSKMCIFVVEDDPQNGFDHVDGHRTVALVVSPYTKRQFVDHTNYNQTGMVKTIELILGLAPMNQLDLSATAMRACFLSTPNLTSYTCLPNKIPLDELNPPTSKLKGLALHWALQSEKLDLADADLADEDTFNRILWHAVRGYETPYPAEYAGAGQPK